MKQKWLIYSAVPLVLLTVSGIWFAQPSSSADPFEEANLDELFGAEEEPEPVNEEQEEDGTLMIDVKGEVNKPGVYELEANRRVIDAISLAGGTTEDGSEVSVNLAEKLSDEMVVYVPHIDEQLDVAVAESWADDGEAESDTVNINTSDELALQSLPGIGPAKAAAIVQYRDEYGPFSVTSDLMNVSGIGEKSFAALEDLIEI